MCQPVPVRQCGNRSGLCHPGQAIVVADLVKGLDQRLGPDGISNPQPRQPMRLGKCPHPDHARVGGVKRRGGAGRGEVDVGFVEDQQCPGGHVVDHPGDGVGAVVAAHRIVGIGDVDQFCLRFPGLGDQTGGVFMVAGIGDGVQGAAIARHVKVEGRIGPGAGHNMVARPDQQAADKAQQAVDPFARHDVGRITAMMGGDGGAQVVHFRVGVFPAVNRRGLHCGNGAGRGAEGGFVRPKAGFERHAPGAFLRLGSDKGHGGGQAGGQRRQLGRW